MTARQGLGMDGYLMGICLFLARTWTLEGDNCALGPGPFLSEQRITLVW